jgi:hypothetical protein
MSRDETLFIPTSCRHGCYAPLIKLPIPEAQRQLLQYGKPCSGSFLWAETGAMLKSSVIAHLECRAMISQPLCADT